MDWYVAFWRVWPMSSSSKCKRNYTKFEIGTKLLFAVPNSKWTRHASVARTFLPRTALYVTTTLITTDSAGTSLASSTVIVITTWTAETFATCLPSFFGAYPGSRTVWVSIALFIRRSSKDTRVKWTFLPWRAILVDKTFSAPRSSVATVLLPKEISNVAPYVGHFDAFPRGKVGLSPQRSSSECLAISVWAALRGYGNSWGEDGEGKNNFKWWNHFVKSSQSIPQE